MGLAGALVALCDGLRLELRAIDVAVCVHGLLQRVVLPPEHVVAVVAVAGAVAKAPHKRLLLRLLRPQRLVVELCRVPDDLEEELRDLDRVRRRARSVVLKRARRRVGDVRHVVGRVEVLAVPAAGQVKLSSVGCSVYQIRGMREDIRWKADVGHDAGRAGLSGEVKRLAGASHDGLQARVGQLAEALRLLFGAVALLADEHAEALRGALV